MHPLGTEGWDGQLGQRPMDGTPRDVLSLSTCPLGTEGMGRTAETEGYRWSHAIGLMGVPNSPWTVDGNTGQPSLGKQITFIVVVQEAIHDSTIFLLQSTIAN